MSGATKPRVAVVGGGASAAHFAQSALARGWHVTLYDVGRRRPEPVAPSASFRELKAGATDASRYFLGADFSGVLFPGGDGEYYGFPPHRAYVFAPHASQPLRTRGLDPLVSFARGGLAEAWTGAAFPFGDGELADWPLRHADLAPHYDEVARRIGIVGAVDDLASFVPAHAHLDEPLDLDAHSAALLERYTHRRGELNSGLGLYVGRTRAAVLRADRGDRKACDRKGRCLWGCPNDAIYSPAFTLRELETSSDFACVDRAFVRRLEWDDGGRVRALIVERDDGAVERHAFERVVLAAGTLSTSRLLLASRLAAGERDVAFDGLMDNRQVLVPFVNTSRLGATVEWESYQYHQLALGLRAEDPRHYVHGLITTLKAALVHPIAQSVPLDLRVALDLARNAHAALGLVNLNFHDTRRAQNRVALGSNESMAPLEIEYRPQAGERAHLDDAVARLRKALGKLGCLVPPGMVHVRPMGASVHYAGTVPMQASGPDWTSTPQGRVRAVENLWIADGSTFPFLPAKNLTFTLMANAARIAAGDDWVI